MRLLLDTHALVWWWLEDARLPDALRLAIADRRNAVHVSAAVGWEIATKVRKGRMPQMAQHIAYFDAYVVDDGFSHLPVRHDHAVRAGLIEGSHRDPFDRMLVAQAMIEELTLATRDRKLAELGCEVLW